MSSGPTVTVAEGTIENISKTALVFGDDVSSTAKLEGSFEHNSDTSMLDTKDKSVKALNCIGKEKSMNQGDSGDLINSSSNHILRPTKMENMKVNVLKKPVQGKSQSVGNYIENQLPLSQTIGASGDALPANGRIKLLSNQNTNLATTNHCDEPDGGDRIFAVVSKTDTNSYTFSRHSFNTSGQTYAKAAQSSPAHVKSENDPKPPKNNDILPTANHVENQTAVGIANGTLESDVIDSAEVVDSRESEKPEAAHSQVTALKETIGHVTRLSSETTSKNNDEKASEQEIQILSNPDRVSEGIQDSQEGPMTNADGDAAPNSKLNSPPRRETEKPPRMQKQRSQDRLLLKQQKNSFDTDSKRENLSRESSIECVDSTGVDVHEFLISTLRNSTRDRAILLKIEHDMISFVNDKTIGFMKFPPMSSYHRMLVHRVAAYFGMDHNVDETGKSVIINKTSSTRIPETRFADQFDPSRHNDAHPGRREEDMRRSILKRTNQSRSFDRDDKGRPSWKGQRSIEERQENYVKTRARIFNEHEAMYGDRAISSMAAGRITSWTDRPWNSTDMDLGMRLPGHGHLTTRASSYSGINLPRHNSANSMKTGSSNSVSSVNGVNGMHGHSGQGRQPVNMGPRPPTPNRRMGMNDGGGNGTYYYMQHQNQDVPFDAVEDDIAQSWFPDSPEPINGTCNSEMVVSTDNPILLAVPYGITLPPETVLCHPITGLPYLSPEGFQLVYHSGPSGGGGMSSPQYARYYQMPPHHSHQHPGMGYTQTYNPYDESQQKAQGPNSTDYTMISPNYPHNIPAATTTVYSGMQGLSNINYTYPPGVYRPTSDPSMAGNSSAQPVQSVPPPQGKQTPVMQGQNYIQPSASNPYPPRFVGGPPVNQSAGQHHGMKEGAVPINNPLGGVNTPRNMMTPPVPVMHPAYPQQPVVFSPPVTNSVPVNDNYSQSAASEPSKSSNPSERMKKSSDDELNKKLQAIKLKNFQQQSQVPEAALSDSINTVTTTLTPSNNMATVQNSKLVPEAAQNQSRIVSNAPIVNQTQHHRGPPDEQGYSYQYANGMQHPQPVQVYLMPTNNTAGNASYRTYSQFMTPPQTPHVMGSGMHFVYLSPPVSGVVGVDGTGTVPPNVPIYHPGQIPHHHTHRQPTENVPSYASNTNNNNAINLRTHEPQPSLNNKQANTSTKATLDTSESANHGNAATTELNTDKDNKGTEAEVPEKLEETESISNSKMQGDSKAEITETPVSTAHVCDKVSKPHQSVQIQSSTPSHASNSTSQVYITHNHPTTQQHPNAPLLLSNVAQDYRIAGMSMAGPVTYPAGVVPKYSMYPNISPAPYVYLPASTARNPKLNDMKVFQGQPTQQHSSGLVAVQLPNQNQIQFIPASSIQHQNAVYYAPHNYVATDYVNQSQGPPPASGQASNCVAVDEADAASCSNPPLQGKETVAAESVASPKGDKADVIEKVSTDISTSAIKQEKEVAIEKQ